MATAVNTGRLTAEGYYDTPDIPDGAELVHGVVRVVAPAANAHTLVCRTIFRALDAYVVAQRLGEVFPDGFGYELPPDDDVVRIPDASFVRAGRLPSTFTPRGCVRLGPDLAVEVLSPSDTHSVMRLKLADYAAAGVPLVWVVDLAGRGVDVHTLGAAPRWVGEQGALDGGDVLPGFSLPVRDLFAGVA